MHRVFTIAIAGAALGGCSSFSADSFKSTPPAITVQLESVPPGADAVTSLGPACKTPCSVSVPAPDAGFSVTFTLPKFQPATVTVQVIRNPGDFSTPASTVIDPNPVVAELKPTGPPPNVVRKPKKPKPPAASATAPAAAASPFPSPNAQTR